MLSKRTWFVLLALAVSIGAIACGSDADDDDASGDDEEKDASTAPPDDEEDVVPCGPDYPTVQDGTVAAVGDLSVKLVSADVKPSRQHINNDWIVEIVDAAGQPATAAMLTGAVAYMPAHNHFGVPAPKVEKLPEPARFKLDNLRFQMGGPWDVILDVEQGDSAKSATFKICVE